jgi:hypothetical protein
MLFINSLQLGAILKRNTPRFAAIKESARASSASRWGEEGLGINFKEAQDGIQQFIHR